jgi:hypothetical protein
MARLASLDVPDPVYSALSRRAADSGVTVEEFAARTLAESVANDPATASQSRERAGIIAAMRARWNAAVPEGEGVVEAYLREKRDEAAYGR